MSDYTPIACAFYDVFEIACLRRQRLRLRWRPDTSGVASAAPADAGPVPGGAIERIVQPIGLSTRDGAEWLSARDESGQALTLRLDWIVEAEPLP